MCLPNETALTKIVKAKMKIIRDALPIQIINLFTTCWPIMAAIAATITKYIAAKSIETTINHQLALKAEASN